LAEQGTISFVLHTDQDMSNGNNDEVFVQTLVELPGLGKCLLEHDYYAISIYFQWEIDQQHVGFYIALPELPGPADYSVQFTWDSQRGLSDGYFNGVSFRTERQEFYYPWEVLGQAIEYQLPRGPHRVTDVQVWPRYTPPDQIEKLVPAELIGQGADLLGGAPVPEPLDVEPRKGELLYSNPLSSRDMMRDWIIEGPATISFQNNKMIMESQIPDPPDGSTGHFNYWCPEEFPDDIVVEWEFQPLTDRGVAHLFFAARGEQGQSVFDPGLPPRDGHFSQYIDDALDNYYIIYFSNRLRTTNFATTWAMKSNNSALMNLGRIAVDPASREFHHMRLIKEGGHLQLQADGQVYIDITDPGGARWGPVLEGGWISFRQMAVTRAAYRNLNIWQLR
jgi:hypothetical protein